MKTVLMRYQYTGEISRMINAKKTEDLLKYISSRLSGRDDCKKINYKVTISNTRITMEPLIYVYPNRYNRKETDKIDIVTFVLIYKMPHIMLDDFVTGRYEYQLSADGKNRRWRKLDEA